METNSEKKVIWAALSIIACQSLGIDVSSLGALSGQISPEMIIREGDGSMWAAIVAAVYAAARTYRKGQK